MGNTREARYSGNQCWMNKLYMLRCQKTSQTFTENGTFTPTTTTVRVQCWGAGQGGNSRPHGSQHPQNGAGGYGGDYAETTITVVPGNPYAVVVGLGSAGSIGGAVAGPGGDSYFDTGLQVYARGGSSVGTNVGTIIFTGGAGGFPNGGGGGGAGSESNGGVDPGDGTGGPGGVPDGGNGGDNGAVTLNTFGLPGTAPGGAGGGSGGGGISPVYQAGDGANGQVIVSW